MFSFTQRHIRPMLLVVLCLSAASLAAPASFTFSGAFNRDDQVQLFNVTTTAPALVDLRSFGYGGGVSSPGGAISAGGLDTVLTLFSSTGNFLAENDDGIDVSLDPSTGAAYDARLTINLLPGSYIVALTQYDNFATGATLAGGFDRTGTPNFTAGSDFSSGEPCPGGLFRDQSETGGQCRTGDWTINFGNVAQVTVVPDTAIPEPASWLLLSVALTAMLAWLKRRQAALPNNKNG